MHNLSSISPVSHAERERKRKREKKKVNDPCSAIAVYAWVTQKPGWAGFLVGLVFLHNHANSTFILRTVLLEEVVGLGLCRWLGVGVIQEILDAKQELLNSDGRSPTLFLIQNWQANRSGRVDIRVEKCRREFAWTVLVLVLCCNHSDSSQQRLSSGELPHEYIAKETRTFGGLGRVF